MRTTIEMPDELLEKAKLHAEAKGISLKTFFINAVEAQLTPSKRVRCDPPTVGKPGGPVIRVLTGEEIDAALFG